jgi:hypothetical protein
MCGKGWGEHGGHNCISTGNRGAWVIKWITLLCILIS